MLVLFFFLLSFNACANLAGSTRRIDFTAVVDIEEGNSPSRGKAAAPITIVEFADFQCPACREASQTIADLAADYPDEVRIVFKHLPLPLHHEALPASFAAIAAGNQKKFWEMHDLLFENQSMLGPDTYIRLARELNLDVKRFQKEMANEAAAAQIRADMSIARRLKLDATPRYFINGSYAGGNERRSEYEALIAAWRKELGLQKNQEN